MGMHGPHVFPLPYFVASVSVTSKRARARDQPREVSRLANLWITCLNWTHVGPGFAANEWQPTAAQRRVHDSLYERARIFIGRTCQHAPPGEVVRNHMSLNKVAYEGRPPVLPLGLHAGVPEQASTV